MTNQQTYENHLHDTEYRWFAIYTRYKREKVVSKALEKKNIDCYLPLNKVTRRWGRKVKELEIPLINCYLFVKINKIQYIKVLETENVLKFVRFSKNLIAIPEEEIDLIKRITGEFNDISVGTECVKKGDKVEVIGGALTGMKGLLVDKDDRKKFVVELHSLSCNITMEVDPKFLRKITF